MTHRMLLPVLFLLAVGATDALPCSCIQIADADPVAAVGETGAVFRARVVATVAVLTNDDGAIFRSGQPETPTGYVQRLVALRVEELFKGEVAPLTILITGVQEATAAIASKKARSTWFLRRSLPRSV